MVIYMNKITANSVIMASLSDTEGVDVSVTNSEENELANVESETNNNEEANIDAAGTDEAVTDEAKDDTIADEAINMESTTGEGIYESGLNMDPAYMGGLDAGMLVEPTMAEGKGSLLSSWPFVIGISAAVLVISIVVGALLAKLKIKKGIELYED